PPTVWSTADRWVYRLLQRLRGDNGDQIHQLKDTQDTQNTQPTAKQPCWRDPVLSFLTLSLKAATYSTAVGIDTLMTVIIFIIPLSQVSTS
ncbi:hypothetical protein O988_01458, partial [Pseudogymnoascus sp. VKM F-3808]